MMMYFFDSLMGTILLSGMMTFVVGTCWVLTIAMKELLNEWGIDNVLVRGKRGCKTGR